MTAFIWSYNPVDYTTPTRVSQRVYVSKIRMRLPLRGHRVTGTLEQQMRLSWWWFKQL